MILAAGRGERLRPITDHTPKPLVMVGNKRLIEHHIIGLVQGGFERIVINVSHLGDQIINHLGDGKRYGIEIVYSTEETALETGGGIRNALPLLRSDTFVVVNGDVFTDYPFNTTFLGNTETSPLIHLVMVENPAHNPSGDFVLSKDNEIEHNAHNVHALTFSGIGYYHRSVFTALENGKFPLAPIIKDHIKRKRVSGALYRGLWVDVGTTDRLEEANRAAAL